jgi:hypothetical protein
MVEDSMATAIMKRPAPTLNVEAETPWSLHGDTTLKPNPTPSASKRSVMAADAMAPAITAPHDKVVASAAISVSTTAAMASSRLPPDGTNNAAPPCVFLHFKDLVWHLRFRTCVLRHAL